MEHVTQIERNVASQEFVKVFKGSFFVLLYGALEKTVFYLVNQCIQILNGKHEKLLDLKPVLWAIVFNDECNAIHDARDKKWTKRWELFSQVQDVEAKRMNDDLYPTTTGNIKLPQIEGLWRIFGISTLARMNEFGQDVKVMNALGHNLGCFGWVGSVIPLYQKELKAVETLKDHKFEEVKIWGARMAEYLKGRWRERKIADLERNE